MAKKTKQQLLYLRDAVSMQEFFNNYLGIDRSLIPEHDIKVSHRDLRDFNNPYIRSISFDYVDENYQDVLSNRIVLVSDYRRQIVPYINPVELERISRRYQTRRIFFGLYHKLERLKAELDDAKEEVNEEYLKTLERYQKVRIEYWLEEESYRLLEKIRGEQKGEEYYGKYKRKRRVK